MPFESRNLPVAACVILIVGVLVLNSSVATAHVVIDAVMLPLALLTCAFAAYRFGMVRAMGISTGVGLAGSIGVHAFDLNTAAMLVIAAAMLGRLRELVELRDRRFHALAENATELVLVVGPQATAIYASPSFATLLGYAPHALLGAGYHVLTGGPEGSVLAETFERVRPQAGDVHRFEVEIIARDGTPHSLDVVATNCLGDPAVAGVIFNARDISENREAQAQLVKQSMYDTLTGLPNRSMLNRRLAEELSARAKRQGRLALLIIDLDRFKDVNDVLGHQFGDALLCEVAIRLRDQIRNEGALARLGGDEFAIALIDQTPEEVQTTAERIVQALSRPFSMPGQRIAIGGTVGIALAEPDSTPSSLLRQADVAMYTAKRRRTGVALYAADEDGRAITRLTMSSALPKAIANNQLVLYYQPQLEIGTGAVKGAEVLVRWQHPERGLLLPDLFLPIAEEIGLIEPLTDWVLENAIAQLATWNNAGLDMRIAVNLSAHDLRDERLATIVPRLLSRYAQKAASLCLELTETTMVTETERAAACLRGLAAQGVRVAIDDFGTGYSSLSHLKQFPVDEVKIDKQFVMGMVGDSHDAAIVRSTIELAHRLDLDVVVEGVEDEPTFAAISLLRADYAQGFAIARPLPAPAFAAWLLGHRGNADAFHASASA